MAFREQFLDTLVHIPPVHALADLTAGEATRPPAAGVHSIAAILGHVEFWQAWFLDRCEAIATPMPPTAAAGWPTVAPEQWQHLLGRFEGGLARAVALGAETDRLDSPVAPAIEFPALGRYTIRDTLTHVAQHNSHHLGQIILLRQLMGRWPPPQGSWTW